MSQASSKSNLAKLLATENLTVEHGNYQTASFDVKNRILRLPIWKEMGNDLYDLLVLHEVGHALYTPEEGWHKSVTEKGAGFKSFLNVIEDARIERKVKDKYPGGRRSFSQGYLELVRKDFFGINGYDVNELPLIDRINLYFKGGSIHDIQFSAEEMVFVDRTANTLTWSDVVKLAEDLYEYSKTEESFTDQSEHMFDELNGDDGESMEMVEQDDENSSGSGQSSETTKQKKMNSGNEDESDSEDGESEEGSDSPGSGSEGGEGPSSMTDDNFRSRENELVEDSGETEVFYAYFPEANLDNIIVPHNVLQQRISDYYKQFTTEMVQSDDTFWKNHRYSSEPIEVARKYFIEFRKNNKKVIDYLVKEFEMKKAAEAHSRTRSANTGIIDSNVLHTYKYNENIFKKMNVTEDGKNHGLVMVVDWSGSMQTNLLGTIEQMVILVMFCKRVNIPFEVYLFSDNYPRTDITDKYNQPRWTHKKIQRGDLCIGRVSLLNVFSSKMKSKEFNEATLNMFALGMAMSSRFYYSYSQRVPYPEYMELGGTPLNQSLLVMGTLMPEFKASTNVDIVNLIYLTDGEGFSDSRAWNISNKHELPGIHVETHRIESGIKWETDKDGKFVAKKAKCFITDRKTKRQYSYQREDRYGCKEMTRLILTYLRESLDINVVNFFIRGGRVSSGEYSVFCETPDQVIKAQKSWKQSGFMVIPNGHGWSSLYMIKGGDNMETKEQTLQVSDDATKGQLKRAFSKMTKGKLQNRVLLSNFIEMVA